MNVPALELLLHYRASDFHPTFCDTLLSFIIPVLIAFVMSELTSQLAQDLGDATLPDVSQVLYLGGHLLKMRLAPMYKRGELRLWWASRPTKDATVLGRLQILARSTRCTSVRNK